MFAPKTKAIHPFLMLLMPQNQLFSFLSNERNNPASFAISFSPLQLDPYDSIDNKEINDILNTLNVLHL